ncbi:hypothetical protein GQ43DRAFT_292015 [Delitschia confertaspora ATCC 74209]|uniref:Secreted protein n=1 Tax=Delitschia confertaspora ATCC 74209 TaxID=1513339 RepID=A0A9P4JPS4_9PLEO|nr:hypothetical protein GQ43DRAFT_292015 [Delitschia confertaspora ATCC 74209]
MSAFPFPAAHSWYRPFLVSLLPLISARLAASKHASFYEAGCALIIRRVRGDQLTRIIIEPSLPHRVFLQSQCIRIASTPECAGPRALAPKQGTSYR